MWNANISVRLTALKAAKNMNWLIFLPNGWKQRKITKLLFEYTLFSHKLMESFKFLIISLNFISYLWFKQIISINLWLFLQRAQIGFAQQITDHRQPVTAPNGDFLEKEKIWKFRFFLTFPPSPLFRTSQGSPNAPVAMASSVRRFSNAFTWSELHASIRCWLFGIWSFAQTWKLWKI